MIFIKNLPCIVCGMGPCDNAHIETGGMGRKADADQIVPLCNWHHHVLHKFGRRFFKSVNFEAAAEATERAWQASRGAA